MSRIESYIERERDLFNEMLKAEIEDRAKAAKVLNVPFEIKDIEISTGSTAGKIRVWKGIDRLAEVVGAVTRVEDEATSDRIFTYIRFDYEGTIFEQMSGSRSTKED